MCKGCGEGWERGGGKEVERGGDGGGEEGRGGGEGGRGGGEARKGAEGRREAGEAGRRGRRGREGVQASPKGGFQTRRADGSRVTLPRLSCSKWLCGVE